LQNTVQPYLKTLKIKKFIMYLVEMFGSYISFFVNSKSNVLKKFWIKSVQLLLSIFPYQKRKREDNKEDCSIPFPFLSFPINRVETELLKLLLGDLSVQIYHNIYYTAPRHDKKGNNETVSARFMQPSLPASTSEKR